MILYFTGTGNSRFIAKKLGELLGDEVYAMSEDIKAHRTGDFPTVKKLIVVTPTYMSRMPPKVEKYIRESVFSENCEAYFVFSAAEAMGQAAKYCRKLCAGKNLNYKGTTAIKSPANYVVMYDVTPRDQAKAEMEKAVPAIKAAADVIRSGGVLSVDPVFHKHNAFSGIAPAIVAMANAKGFHVSDACISCGSCERACPLGNVRIVHGKPTWGADCTHCMGCISVCPKKAIDYGKKTESRNRYYLPE